MNKYRKIDVAASRPPTRIAGKAFLRSVFAGGSFARDHMQSLGLAASMAPVFQKQDDPKQAARGLLRYLEYFNTNPYMIGYVVGALVRLEWDRMQGGRPTEDEIDRFKNVLGPSLGGLGDHLFWGTLRPLALTIAIICAISGSYVGLSLCFVLYLGVVGYVRVTGFRSGFARGLRVVEVVTSPGLALFAKGARAVFAVSAGVFVAYAFHRASAAPVVSPWTSAFLLSGVFFAARRDISSSLIAIGIFLLTLILVII